MKKHKKKHGQGRPALLAFLALAGIAASVSMLLLGADVALLNPKGHIATQQYYLILFSMALMLSVAVPTLIILYAFAWKYRETNRHAEFDPEARHSKFLVPAMWAIPTVGVLLLASVMWPATHRLEPKKTIAAEAEPLTIKVVALRWKWLFIYPDQNIATVNYVQIPVDTPVQFDLTADEAPMSSFWIPHLGGQLYAMTGHVNRLNLMADEPGDYPGSSAEINGRGFAGMRFTARATSRAEFDKWAQDRQLSSDILDSDEYERLLKPSENNTPAFYSPVEAGLYAKMLMKYSGSHEHQTSTDETGH